MKAFCERGRRTAIMNEEVMTCLLIEWMKKEGNPRTDSHSMEGTWMSPRSWGLTGGSTITPSSQQAVTPLTLWSQTVVEPSCASAFFICKMGCCKD